MLYKHRKQRRKMVKYEHNDVGIDINDFDANDQPSCLPLGRLGKNKRLGAAIANERPITETAKILKCLGEFDLEVNQEKPEKRRQSEQHIPVKEHFSSCLKKIIETLDIVLNWLEQSAVKSKNEMGKQNEDKKQNPDEYQKKENVLRGLYHITGLGSYTYFVSLLERACKFLDLPENLYNAKREHVKECLKEVEEKKKRAFQLVEQECDLLQDITNEPQLNVGKTAKFNGNVKQANVIIESCREMLSSAEETINELTTIAHVIKWFSRAIRLVGFGVTCYFLYHTIPSTTTQVDSLATYLTPTTLSLIEKFIPTRGLKYVSFATLCAAAGYGWLTLFQKKQYAFQNHVEELKLRHERLKMSLRGLEGRLEILHHHATK